MPNIACRSAWANLACPICFFFFLSSPMHFCLIFIILAKWRRLILAAVPLLRSSVPVGRGNCCQRLGRGPNNSCLPHVKVSASVLLPLHSTPVLSSPWDPKSRSSSRISIAISISCSTQRGCSSPLVKWPVCTSWSRAVEARRHPLSPRASDDATNGLLEPRPPRGGLAVHVVRPPLRRRVGARLRRRTVRGRRQRLRPPRRQRGRLRLR